MKIQTQTRELFFSPEMPPDPVNRSFQKDKDIICIHMGMKSENRWSEERDMSSWPHKSQMKGMRHCLIRTSVQRKLEFILRKPLHSTDWLFSDFSFGYIQFQDDSQDRRFWFLWGGNCSKASRVKDKRLWEWSNIYISPKGHEGIMISRILWVLSSSKTHTAVELSNWSPSALQILPHYSRISLCSARCKCRYMAWKNTLKYSNTLTLPKTAAGFPQRLFNCARKVFTKQKIPPKPSNYNFVILFSISPLSFHLFLSFYPHSRLSFFHYSLSQVLPLFPCGASCQEADYYHEYSSPTSAACSSYILVSFFHLKS